MKKSEFENIRIAEKSNIFEEKTNLTPHTSYETECMFYNCIKDGDTEKVEEMIWLLLSGSIVVGKLSDDELRQSKYLAVCSVTLAVRYAIAGGLDEETAYEFSDNAIMTVDKLTKKEDIFYFLKNGCIKLTQMVNESKSKPSYPYHIRKCIDYVNANLNEKLDIKGLAEICSLSPDYLSSLFKKTTGQTLSSYINVKRLEQAKQLLLSGYRSSDVAYYLNYCSESYFIKCFKEKYGVTPSKFHG